MQIISVFLKNVWKSKIRHLSFDSSFLGFVLLVATIPLSLGVNNAVLIITLFIGLVSINKENIRFSKFDIPLLLFFGWTCCSYCWSIDADQTLKAIPKGLVLLLLPLLFSIKKKFTHYQKNQVIKLYSYAMVAYVVFYLLKALFRFIISGTTDVFFYHELVTLNVNAIHVSVYVSLAFFYFLKQEQQPFLNQVILVLLLGFLFLLSSKNILLVTVAISILYLLYTQKVRLLNLYFLIAVVAISVFVSAKVIDRFQDENLTVTAKKKENGVHVVTPYQAWSNEVFTPNDYFPGTAFRVYQIRVFLDLMREEPVFWKGFGLNASYVKQKEKALAYHVFLGNKDQKGYQNKNYHNQYIQVFSDLGVIGFVIFLTMLLLNLINGIKNKDFMHIIFAILMISLFLTESFIWRQRGMVFFVSFYCFFNSSNKLKKIPL